MVVSMPLLFQAQVDFEGVKLTQEHDQVRFLFRVTLRRHDLAAEVWHIKEPRCRRCLAPRRLSVS